MNDPNRVEMLLASNLISVEIVHAMQKFNVASHAGHESERSLTLWNQLGRLALIWKSIGFNH